jgi:DAK2 domain fusion protein YloV
VSTPVEGTILSVAAAVAEAARSSGAAEDSRALVTILRLAFEAAAAEVLQSPQKLRVLEEAGVVDAGGRGLEVILAGMLEAAGGRVPAGKAAPRLPLDDGASAPRTDLPHAVEPPLAPLADLADAPYGYCTEFLVVREGVAASALREGLEPLGDSLIVAAAPGCARVHIHTFRPGRALEFAADHGALHRIKIENMTEQMAHAHPETMAARAGTVVVAVAAGPGLALAFESLGAVAVAGGRTMNPAADELLEPVRRLGGAHAILLPNHKNVIAAARQAAALAGLPVRVVPTRTAAEGLAALVAFAADAELEDNAERMAAAAAAVTTIEIARAVRDAAVAGRRIAEGDWIAFVDQAPSGVGSTPDAALEEALGDLESPELVTLIVGIDADPEVSDAIRARLQAAWPAAEIEELDGGQPGYPWILGVESQS